MLTCNRGENRRTLSQIAPLVVLSARSNAATLGRLLTGTGDALWPSNRTSPKHTTIGFLKSEISSLKEGLGSNTMDLYLRKRLVEEAARQPYFVDFLKSKKSLSQRV